MIRSYNGWQETSETKWHLELSTEDKGALYYFGAYHITDVAHPQFSDISKAWKVFKPTVAFFEGPDRGVMTTDTGTIKKLGESGYIRFLANEAQVKTYTLEPPIDELYSYLVSRHPQQEVDIYMFAKEAMRLRTRKAANEKQLTEDIGNMMKQIPQLLKQPTSITNVAQLDSIVKAQFQGKVEWWNMPETWFSPNVTEAETGSFTNTLNTLSSEYRNIHMVRLLGRHLQNGERVFAVVGRNHIPMQMEALKCIALKK